MSEELASLQLVFLNAPQAHEGRARNGSKAEATAPDYSDAAKRNLVRPWHLLALAALALPSSSCVYARMFYFNTPTLSAPTYFDSRTVHASPAPLALANVPEPSAFQLTPSQKGIYRSFDDMLEANQTRAFVVIHDGAIVYERYFGEVTATTKLPAFSMSKSFAAVLVGCALDDGLLASVDTPVTTYIPELAAKKGYGDVTLDQLLRMTSGIDFDEESEAGARLYYSTDLRRQLYSYDVTRKPGERYLYGSLNIQLLWDALARQLPGTTVSHYFEERLWGPLGAEHAATWSLDSDAGGVEKLFAGFNATARDHARLGLLFLHEGVLNGKRIVSRNWVKESLTQDPIVGLVHTSDGAVRRGKYQWFLTRDDRAYFAKGYNGQYIFVVPDKNAVFVRFGEAYGETDWPALFLSLADLLD